ncbi:MAG: nucleotide exchange factor GrpE [Clostridia bacterium]|nr:nucleotide exchange factor GrpE [Clostridia bacterium]
MSEEKILEGEAVETAQTPETEETKETVNEAAPAEEKADKADKKKSKKLEAKISELEAKLADADKTAAEQNDKYLRLMAEYDNFRKRSAKEKEGIYSDAYADALKSILPIIDNLERAVGVEGAEAVAKGLEMTLKGASEALEKMGVEAFGAEGDEFDPNMHNAMMMVDDENHKEGEIVTVFQKGYKKGDKIIRYAMVTVAN